MIITLSMYTIKGREVIACEEWLMPRIELNKLREVLKWLWET